MKGFLKSKLFFSLIAVVLLASAIIGPLAENFIAAHAQAPELIYVGEAKANTFPAELIYVANITNSSTHPVQAYDATSTGKVAPVRTINDPHNPDTVWDPWGVTFDSSNNLYVQSFLSDATTFVFGPNAGAGSLPIRIFVLSPCNPDNRSIAVDGNGFEYVLGTESGATICVGPPHANGQPGTLYSVPSVRTIDTAEGFGSPWPDSLTIGTNNQIIAALQQGAIKTFAGGANGGASPLRTISGTRTGLAGGNLSVTFSPSTGLIYAAVSAGTNTHISMFPRIATGDVTPFLTIQGTATGLTGKVITGIAVSQVTGDIYVMVKPAQFSGPAQIEVFNRFANGNTKPLRTFTDRNTAFTDAAGIAITSH